MRQSTKTTYLTYLSELAGVSQHAAVRDQGIYYMASTPPPQKAALEHIGGQSSGRWFSLPLCFSAGMYALCQSPNCTSNDAN